MCGNGKYSWVFSILKLVNYSCSSYPTRVSYSGQVDEFRNPMKRVENTAVFETRFQTQMHVDKATKTRGDKQHYIITHFTKQTLKLNYLLLMLNVMVQFYPKQKSPFSKFKFSLNGGDLHVLVHFQPCCTFPNKNGIDVRNFETKCTSYLGIALATHFFLFVTSFRRSKCALCHLLYEAMCSLRTNKQLLR